MAHPFDVDDLSNDVIQALNNALGDDITTYVAYAKRQTKALAKQAAWIAEATLVGELDEDDRDRFLADLGRLIENFVRTIVALTLLTLEKAWNAIVEAIWKAINLALSAATGIVLPIPAAPQP